MNVASKELCQELASLSGWNDTPLLYGAFMKYTVRIDDESVIYTRREMEDAEGYAIHEDCPAYDLGYLLRKLSPKLEIKGDTYGLVITPCTSDGSWIADYLVASWGQPLAEHNSHWLHHGDNASLTEAATPEDAVVRLASQLFRSGILKRDGELNA